MKKISLYAKALALMSALVCVPVYGTIHYAADFDTTGTTELSHTGSLSVSEQSANSGGHSTQVLTAPAPVSGRPGSRALRFELRREDPDVSSGSRSELSLGNTSQSGTSWYAWSLYVPSNSNYDGTAEILGQIHGDDTFRRPPFDMTRELLSGEQKWRARWRWDISSDPKGSGDSSSFANVLQDQWNDFIVKITWSNSGNGQLVIWLNSDSESTPTLTRNNISIGYPDQTQNYWKYGIYKWPWSGNNSTSSYRAVAWFDEVRLGNSSETFATMMPVRGGGGTPTVATPTFSPAGGTYSSTQSVTLSSSTSGASIRYTTDGSTPSDTVGTVYSGPLAVSGNATIKGIAYKTGLTSSAVTSATYTFVAPGTVVVSAGGVFTNTAMTSQTGTFTATFNATPSADPTNAVVALSNGSQTAFSGFACAVRFNTSGNIDARNGGAYAAASTIPYAPNTTYTFRVVANIPAHTYSIYVTPAGGSEVTVGINYAFRTEQATVASLNNWGAVVDVSANGGAGTLTVASFAIGGVAPSAPVFTPAGGTYTSAQSVTITSSGSTSIRYTSDGSTPSATVGTVYSGPVSIGASGTLKAVGINTTGVSPVTTGAYTINIPSTTTLTATADTYAFGGSTATNYGTATVLGAKDDGTTSVSFDRIAYVKFDLSGLAFTPTTATLILATDATTAAGTVTVNQCTTDSWTETGLTWANKPATGATIGTATVAAGVVTDKSINVGSYVNSQYTGDATKIVSFALTGNNAQLYFKSREAGAGNAPELVVGN